MADRSSLTNEQRDLVARMTGCEPADAHLFADNTYKRPWVKEKKVLQYDFHRFF